MGQYIKTLNNQYRNILTKEIKQTLKNGDKLGVYTDGYYKELYSVSEPASIYKFYNRTNGTFSMEKKAAYFDGENYSLEAIHDEETNMYYSPIDSQFSMGEPECDYLFAKVYLSSPDRKQALQLLIAALEKNHAEIKTNIKKYFELYPKYLALLKDVEQNTKEYQQNEPFDIPPMGR